jgi:hypothetical protein
VGARSHLPRQEVADGVGDLLHVGLQREVAGIEEAHIGLGNVALERLHAGRQKERGVLAPRGEEARLVGAEVFLEGGAPSWTSSTKRSPRRPPAEQRGRSVGYCLRSKATRYSWRVR